MAKLAVLFTVVSLLFAFSQARFFTTEPDGTLTDLHESESQSTTAIFLPSQRRDFEPSKLLDFKHDDDAAASATETDSTVGSVPLKKISFHSVNRHFPRRPVVFPFRHHHNHRNCRFNKHFRHMNPRFHQKRFISYGNDMIVSDERSFDPESRGVVRQIEARWGNFHDDGAEFNHRVELMKSFDPESRGVVRQIKARWGNFHDDGAEFNHRVEFMKHHHHDHDHHHEDHDHDHDHDLHHHREHEDTHKHHHHGREEARDSTEKHDGSGLMEKIRRLFLHV